MLPYGTTWSCIVSTSSGGGGGYEDWYCVNSFCRSCNAARNLVMLIDNRSYVEDQGVQGVRERPFAGSSKARYCKSWWPEFSLRTWGVTFTPAVATQDPKTTYPSNACSFGRDLLGRVSYSERRWPLGSGSGRSMGSRELALDIGFGGASMETV